MSSDLSTGGYRSLRNFLEELVWRHFFEDLRLEESGVAHYVSRLLADFAHVDSLYRVRNALGRPLQDVGEMLLESNPLQDAGSFDRERAVRKHVGDFTLFMTGLFPESVAKARRQRSPRLGAFVDYVAAGRVLCHCCQFRSVRISRRSAAVSPRLAENFEMCVFGLHLVKQDLAQYQRDYYDRLQQILEQNG